MCVHVQRIGEACTCVFVFVCVCERERESVCERECARACVCRHL